MKKLLIIFSLLFLYSCGNDKSASSPSEPTLEDISSCSVEKNFSNEEAAESSSNEGKTSSSTAESSSSEGKTSSSKTQSSSSEGKMSSSTAESSSSEGEQSSTSVIEINSSSANTIPSKIYDCNEYNCVPTTYLNPEIE